MTILVIDPAGNLWGSERALLDSLPAFDGVHIVASCPADSELSVELTKRGIKVVHPFAKDLHRKSRIALVVEAAKLWLAVRKVKPEIVYLNQSGILSLAKIACVGTKIRIVCHVRIYEDAGHVCGKLRYFGRNISAIAISRSIYNAVRQCAEKAGAVLPVKHIYDAYIPRSGAMAHSTRQIDMCCVGRITPVKGQLLFAQAFSLPSSGVLRKVKALIVGNGPDGYMNLVQNTLSSSGAPVEIHPYATSVVPILENAKYLVCTSEREPLGRVVLEAWDCGAVPIAFAGSGGAAEIISASGGGLLYSHQTAESLAAVLVKATKLSGEQRAAFVQRGRAWMSMNTDIHVYGDEIKEVLRPRPTTP